MYFSSAIRNTHLPSRLLSAWSMENLWNLGPLRSHLLAFSAPQSKHWSGGHWVCRICSAANDVPNNLWCHFQQCSWEIGSVWARRVGRGVYTVVSCIYAPRFANFVLVESVGGAYMWDLIFYLANTPPLPVPRLDVDIGTLCYRPIEAADLPSLLILSSPKPQKLDGKDRLTEVGHHVDSGIFQAFRGFSLSMCC